MVDGDSRPISASCDSEPFEVVSSIREVPLDETLTGRICRPDGATNHPADGGEDQPLDSLLLGEDPPGDRHSRTLHRLRYRHRRRGRDRVDHDRAPLAWGMTPWSAAVGTTTGRDAGTATTGLWAWLRQ